jgi:hypothetical protein
VHPATDHAAFLGYLGRPEVGVVTITVTEAGYVRAPDGRLDVDRAVIVSDLMILAAVPRGAVSSMPAKLVAGLLARRAAGAGAITILSCDNLSENGGVTKHVVVSLAGLADASLPAWIEDNVDFATSMVDRITPATTDGDRAAVAKACGYVDADPVPTGPFSEWVVSGLFPAAVPGGRAPARGSSTTWRRSSSASCGCSTDRTRCSPTPAASGDTRHRRGDHRRHLPVLGGDVLGGGESTPAAAGRRGGGVPRGAADEVLESQDPPPARADRRGRFRQAGRSVPAHDQG